MSNKEHTPETLLYELCDTFYMAEFMESIELWFLEWLVNSENYNDFKNNELSKFKVLKEFLKNVDEMKKAGKLPKRNSNISG